MNMTEKNGQPSMEEILASIRRIIAEEPLQQHNGELGGTPILLKGDGVLDDAGDFDLPAIFRSSPPQTDRPSPLLGRLTDAIRSATSAQPEEPRAVDGHEVNGHHTGLSTLTLRSTEVRRDEEAVEVNGSVYHTDHHAEPALEFASAAAPLQASASDEPPKRVMVPFKDTHFMRLSGGAPAPSREPQPVAAPVFEIPAPAPYEVAPYEVPPAEVAPVESEPVPVVIPEVPAPVAFVPPPLPAAAVAPQPAAAAHGEGGVEDATADLLRPMLRQWLSENMPRMVEKALHIEIAESVKSPKKP
jgi:uncharacterized protein